MANIEDYAIEENQNCGVTRWHQAITLEEKEMLRQLMETPGIERK